jgi:hypothetical protein
MGLLVRAIVLVPEGTGPVAPRMGPWFSSQQELLVHATIEMTMRSANLRCGGAGSRTHPADEQKLEALHRLAR